MSRSVCLRSTTLTGRHRELRFQRIIHVNAGCIHCLNVCMKRRRNSNTWQAKTCTHWLTDFPVTQPAEQCLSVFNSNQVREIQTAGHSNTVAVTVSLTSEHVKSLSDNKFIIFE